MQAACLNPLDEPPHAERILVIRLGALGDAVRTLPAVSDLRARYPRAHLAWLVEQSAEGAVRAAQGVDEVLVFPREELMASLLERRPVRLVRDAWRFVRELRRRDFDLVLDFHGIFKSGLIARLSGAPVRVGYEPPFSREGAWRFVNRRARIEPTRVSRFERNAALVDFLGIGLRTVPDARSGVAGVLRVHAADALSMGALLGAGPTPILIHPGTSAATPYKRLPVESWGEVIQRLSREGFHCIVSRGSSDAELGVASAIVAASGGAAGLAPPTPRFADLVALTASCRLFLGSDSGPLHVASLVGTPVVQVLGPTDPVENRPWTGTPSRSVRVPVGCSPCRRGCPPAPCMRLIVPETVAAAAIDLLKQEEPSAGEEPSANEEPSAGEEPSANEPPGVARSATPRVREER